MKKYTFGIIGLGVISKYFVAAIQKNSHTELRAVSARSRKTLDAFYAEGDVIARYENYAELISDPMIQVVVIATPNHTHEEMIRSALLAGKHVMCEKPMTMNVSSTRELVALARKRGLLLMTVFHRRYNKELISLFKDVELKKKIRRIHARYLENIPDHSGSSKWHYDVKESGGGCVIDNGINVIDVIQTLVGALTLKRAHLGMKGERLARHDANARLEYTFSGGNAVIELDWYFKGEVKDITLHLSDGSVIHKDMLSDSQEFKGSLWHEYEGAVEDFISRLETGDLQPDEASISAISAVDAAYKNLQ